MCPNGSDSEGEMAILMILPMSILTIRHRRLAWTIGRRLTAARWRPSLSLKEWVEPLHHATHATHQPAKKGFRKNTELPWAALEIRMVKGTFDLFENVLIFHFISFSVISILF